MKHLHWTHTMPRPRAERLLSEVKRVAYSACKGYFEPEFITLEMKDVTCPACLAAAKRAVQ